MVAATPSGLQEPLLGNWRVRLPLDCEFIGSQVLNVSSLSCSIPARAPVVICSTRGSATLPGRCARAPRLAPTRPACKRSPRRQFCSSHASAYHGAPTTPPLPHRCTSCPVSSTAADARGCTLFDAGARMHKTTQVAGTNLHAFIKVADRFGNSCLPQPGQC